MVRHISQYYIYLCPCPSFDDLCLTHRKESLRTDFLPTGGWQTNHDWLKGKSLQIGVDIGSNPIRETTGSHIASRPVFSAQRETKIGGWETAHLAPRICREFLYVDHFSHCKDETFHQVYPESASKQRKVHRWSLSCKWLASHRKRVSSANWGWEIGGAPSLTKNPANSPLSSDFLVNPLSASVTIMNRKEGSGSPCRRPLELWKKPVGEPFTSPYGVRGTMPSLYTPLSTLPWIPFF